MILNFLVFIIACAYLFFTGHYLPAIIGFLMLLTLYKEELYFTTLILCAVTIVSIIYYFWSDYFSYEPGGVLEIGPGILYMLVLLIKAKSIFDNDRFSLD